MRSRFVLIADGSAGASAQARVRTRSVFADWSYILFDQAVLAEGGQLDEPGAFVKGSTS